MSCGFTYKFVWISIIFLIITLVIVKELLNIPIRELFSYCIKADGASSSSFLLRTQLANDGEEDNDLQITN